MIIAALSSIVCVTLFIISQTWWLFCVQICCSVCCFNIFWNCVVFL